MGVAALPGFVGSASGASLGGRSRWFAIRFSLLAWVSWSGGGGACLGWALSNWNLSSLLLEAAEGAMGLGGGLGGIGPE